MFWNATQLLVLDVRLSFSIRTNQPEAQKFAATLARKKEVQ